MDKVLEEINDNLNVLAFFKFKESCKKDRRNNECVNCIKCFNEFKVKLTQKKF